MNMTFQFDSLADLVNMAGHGPYVWVCYLVTALALVYLVVSPVLAQNQFKKAMRRQEKLARAQQRSRQEHSE